MSGVRDALRRYRVHAAAFAVGLVLGVAGAARLGPSAASLDPGVQAGLLLVISVTLAATAGAAGAVLGANIAADAAREAARVAQQNSDADRQDARVARDLDRQDARRFQFADRKLALAVDLLVAADVHLREAEQQVATKWERWNIETDFGVDARPTDPLPEVNPSEPVRRAFLALDIVAPMVAPAAGELYEATVPLGSMAASWTEPASHNDYNKEWSRKWTEARDRWDGARFAFVEAVRNDLGLQLEQ